MNVPLAEMDAAQAAVYTTRTLIEVSLSISISLLTIEHDIDCTKRSKAQMSTKSHGFCDRSPADLIIFFKTDSR